MQSDENDTNNENSESMDEILGELTDMDTFESLVNNSGYNPSAIATSVYNSNFPILKERTTTTKRFLGKWKDVDCPDNTKARILKNPNESFEFYASQWKTNLEAIFRLFGQGNAKGKFERSQEAQKLYDNLGYVEATLREMYKSSYLTFAATPCDPKAQDEKRRMDRIIAIAAVYLLSLKIKIEKIGTQDMKSLIDEVDRTVDKIIDIMSKF
jgi:hypothetical protein